MNYNPYRGPNEPVDDKCHPRFPASRVVSQDYIRIPEGVNSLREFKDNYCDTDLSPLVSTVTSELQFLLINSNIMLSFYNFGNFYFTFINSLMPIIFIIIGKSREPIYVGVHTDEFLAHRDDQNLNDFQEIGFRLKYEIESGNCDMS